MASSSLPEKKEDDETPPPAVASAIVVDRKRSAQEDATTTTKKSRCTNDVTEDDDDEVVDVCTTLGFQPGHRFEVQWELCTTTSTEDDDDADDDNNKADPTPADSTPAATTTQEQQPQNVRWWGATLLPHDGRTHEGVAIRVLDYDAYPEGGFPEHSLEDVIFLDERTLVSPNDLELVLTYRKEGGDEEVRVGSLLGTTTNNSTTEDNVRDTLNVILGQALASKTRDWQRLNASQQAFVAEHVAKGKEKLLEGILEHVQAKEENVITAQDVPQILERAFGDKKK